MRITGLTVSGVGRFTRPVTVAGFGPGVNVLAAPNEAGKSTLFRAIRTCLFRRHGAADERVRALEPNGAQMPVSIAVSFEQDGVAYTIAKTFLRQKSAVLTAAGREIARGDAADEKVWDLLGIRPGSGRSVDEAALGLLWVGQTESFTPPAPSEAAHDRLSTLIEAEVGALTGGDRAREVMARTEAELRPFLTPGGAIATAGPLGRALALAEDLRGRETALAGRLAELDETLTALAGLRDRRAGLDDPAREAEMAAEAAAAEADLAAGRQAAQRLRQLEEAAGIAASQRDAAFVRLADLRDLASRIDASRADRETLSARVGDLQSRIDEAAAARRQTEADIAAVGERIGRLDAEIRALRQIQAVQAEARERAGLAARRAQLADIGRRLVALDGEIGALRVTADMVATLSRLEAERVAVSARLEAGAPHLRIEPSARGAGVLAVGGETIAGVHDRAVLAPVTVTLGDLGRLTITPASGQGVADRERGAEIDRQIADLVAGAGATDPAGLRQMLERRNLLSGERQAVVAELKALGIAERDLPARAGEAATRLAGIDRSVALALERHGLDALPDPARTAADLDGLAREREAAEDARQRLHGLQSRQVAALDGLRTEHGPLAGRLQSLEASLTADLARLPDAERAARLGAFAALARDAEAAAERAGEALALERANAPDATRLEQLQNRATRLASAIERRRAEKVGLQNEIARLEGQVEFAGGEGLGEALAAARDERELAERDAARLQRRVDVLRLVQSSVREALDEGRERYQAPLREALAPFLHDLFPGAELTLGDRFAVTGLRRSAPDAEDLDTLSDGTREQIAVLVRLAMAAMLARAGQEVPVILDDALVYSDDDRIGRMFDSLTRAGDNGQVIVLTCRMRAFEELGGQILAIRPAEPPLSSS